MMFFQRCLSTEWLRLKKEITWCCSPAQEGPSRTACPGPNPIRFLVSPRKKTLQCWLSDSVTWQRLKNAAFRLIELLWTDSTSLLEKVKVLKFSTSENLWCPQTHFFVWFQTAAMTLQEILNFIKFVQRLAREHRFFITRWM